MGLHDTIHRIMDNWDDWSAEAGQESQAAQDPEAGDYLMQKRLRAVLLQYVASETQQQAERIEELERERYLLAMLSSETPLFFNPLHAMAAKTLRDTVLQIGPPNTKERP